MHKKLERLTLQRMGGKVHTTTLGFGLSGGKRCGSEQVGERRAWAEELEPVATAAVPLPEGLQGGGRGGVRGGRLHELDLRLEEEEDDRLPLGPRLPLAHQPLGATMSPPSMQTDRGVVCGIRQGTKHFK